MHAKALLTLFAAAALAIGAPAWAGRMGMAADASVRMSADYLQGRAAGPGSHAWTLVVDRDDDAPADATERTRPWSEPGAMRALAERMSISVARPPSTEGRRGRQVTVGVKLQF